jgi:hypothetical protein
MSIIVYDNPSFDGDPNGSIDGPKGSQFYKTGSFYKINYSGSIPSGWQDVYFQPFNIQGYYLTNDDVKLINQSTGSFLYVKTTGTGSKTGWSLLSTKSPFIFH